MQRNLLFTGLKVIIGIMFKPELIHKSKYYVGTTNMCFHVKTYLILNLP